MTILINYIIQYTLRLSFPTVKVDIDVDKVTVDRLATTALFPPSLTGERETGLFHLQANASDTVNALVE